MIKEQAECLATICAQTGRSLTEEQREFACDFTKPLISFSNPGTGKSASTIVGLIMAQTYHRVPGQKINAMSFTRAATYELKARYDKACKQCGIRPTVKFNTFHSICYSIVRERFPRMKIKSGVEYQRDLPLLQSYMKNAGYDTDDMFYVRRVLDCINSLNSALVFDNANVETKFKFKNLDMPVEAFQSIRVDWFIAGIVTGTIPQGDIPIYALYCLATNPALRKKYQEEYKIMVVDEFQDLSLLHLKILSMISVNLVGIGDIKQQIYAFNGASLRIVQEYKKMYPDAKEVELTQSFRCKNEIAEYATRIYYPNDKTVVAFKGTGDGGKINILQTKQLDLKSIVGKIKKEYEDTYNLKGLRRREVMFLFRNNISATLVAEELYRQKVPFRVNRFAKVMDMPIFKELCQFVYLAQEPANPVYLQNVVKLFPEFKKYNAVNCPLLIAIEKSRSNLFDINYAYREDSTIEILNRLRRVRILLDKGDTAGHIFNELWKIYERYVIENKWWTLEMDKDFYLSMVQPIVEKKTFPQMIAEEYEKEEIINNCNNANDGVRCYTVHSAKGLEADDVYLLDTESVLYPSKSAMRKYINSDCEYEAAADLRNERNLLYVGVTRAVENVYITYQTELSQLLSHPNENEYTYLDAIYERANDDFDDVQSFIELFKLSEEQMASGSAVVQAMSESEEEGVEV